MPARVTRTRTADETRHEEALERFRLASSAEDERRQRQLHDYKFSIGRKNATESYQWDQTDSRLRKGRITLTHNRIGPHIRQTLNQIRQARQSIKVVPVDNGADPDKAEVRQGVFRCIESKSKALTAYIMAADQQMRMGEGFVRVLSEYVRGAGGKLQELKVKPIRNRFSVYADPNAQEYDGSDWEYLFITEDVDPKAYTQRYSKSTAAQLTNVRGVGDVARDWFLNGSIRIAEYFSVVTEWQDGEVLERKVYWAKMNGLEWLSPPRLLPIPYIPVARAVGEVTDVEGKVDYRGVVPDAMDAQKSLNYEESATAEAFGIAPKAPYTGYAASILGRPEWQDANLKNYSFLGANTIDPQNPTSGILPLPQRNIASPDISAMVIAGQRAENNLRNALGVVDVDASERSREQSGRAIRERRMQNDLSNSHFAENLGLMIQQVGRILDAWVPHIYDAPRVMDIVGADDRRRTVMVHAGAQMAPPNGPPEGVDGVYDLAIGRYDIEIDVGPSYLTQRKEAVEMMTEVVTAAPALLEVIGDLYFGHMDWAPARQIGERFKKRLPKELQDAEPGEPAPLPPEVQQQMAAMQQQHQLLTQELQAKTEEVETQQAKAQADLQAKQTQIASAEQIKLAEIKSEEKIAAAKLDQEYRLAVMKLDFERELAQLKANQAAAQLEQTRELHDTDTVVQQAESAADRDHARTLQAEKPKPKPNGAGG